MKWTLVLCKYHILLGSELVLYICSITYWFIVCLIVIYVLEFLCTIIFRVYYKARSFHPSNGLLWNGVHDWALVVYVIRTVENRCNFIFFIFHFIYFIDSNVKTNSEIYLFFLWKHLLNNHLTTARESRNCCWHTLSEQSLCTSTETFSVKDVVLSVWRLKINDLMHLPNIRKLNKKCFMRRNLTSRHSLKARPKKDT